VSHINGRAWVFGDDVNTDVMAPGLYFKSPMSEMARHCMEAIDADFARNVRPGDIVLAGHNFGIGSAREQAAMALQHLGVGAVLAQSFGRIFYRNALNFGIPTIIFPSAPEIRPGDDLLLDPVMGDIENRTSGKIYKVGGLPAHLMTMIDAGGLMPYLKKRLGKKDGEAQE
jgi:3-isopropylmalate/(R)-2-methylmalate dehydratase small subunit